MSPTPDPYQHLPERLNTLLRKEVTASLRHAFNPGVIGPDAAALGYWACRYEASAALAEQNGFVGSRLLPRAISAVLMGPGLPYVPGGVQFRVDDPAAGNGKVSLRVLVSGVTTMNAARLGGAVSAVTLMPHPTYTDAVFDAPADGLYRINIFVGSTKLSTFFVSVNRAAFRRFRENSRAEDFLTQRYLPAPGADYRLRLALLYAKEAAARTNQVDIYNRLDAAEAAVSYPSTPIHRYPYV